MPTDDQGQVHLSLGLVELFLLPMLCMMKHQFSMVGKEAKVMDLLVGAKDAIDSLTLISRRIIVDDNSSMGLIIRGPWDSVLQFKSGSGQTRAAAWSSYNQSSTLGIAQPSHLSLPAPSTGYGPRPKHWAQGPTTLVCYQLCMQSSHIAAFCPYLDQNFQIPQAHIL